ncbi:hypothetical protein ABVT39_007346 [Epinephelus coioides]
MQLVANTQQLVAYNRLLHPAFTYVAAAAPAGKCLDGHADPRLAGVSSAPPRLAGPCRGYGAQWQHERTDPRLVGASLAPPQPAGPRGRPRPHVLLHNKLGHGL